MLGRKALGFAYLSLIPLFACFSERIAGVYCSVGADCASSAPYTECDATHHTCVVPGSIDMGGGGDMLPMIGCKDASGCLASVPVCGPMGQCVPCPTPGMSTECAMYHSATPLCGPNGGCVQCVSKDNCDDPLHQTCNTMTGMCAPCVTNADCTSGLCNAGSCADKSTLLYVNNADGAACSDGGPGSYTQPFCSVQRGLNAAAAANKKLIVFAGKGYAESLAVNNTNNYSVTVIGVGSPVVKPPGAQPALTVAGNSMSGNSVTLSMDGFVFDGAMLTGSTDLVQCTGSNTTGQAVLTLTRSTLRAGAGYGVNAQAKCTVNMDADLVRDNRAGALALNASDFALTNLIVVGNGTATSGGTPGSSVGGIVVSGMPDAGKATIANVTLFNNKADTQAAASAMQCPVATVKTINTVVFGNVGGSAEVQSACIGTVAVPQMTYSAFVGGSSMLNDEDLTGCAAAMLFVDAGNGDFTPKKGSAAPCTLIDKGTGTGAPDHDYNGTPRPQPVGGAWDIGAIEAM